MAAKRTRSERLRARLVRDLQAKGVIASDTVKGAFLEVPRERFVPDVAEQGALEAVYRDEAIVTKRDRHGRPLSSSSQPALMAKMLELLAPRPGDRVLEIGTGTGYNAALLADMVGPQGRVTSIDVDPGVARTARRALRETGHPVSVAVGDGRAGYAKRAPYDRIIVTACADEIPLAWLEQLTDGGRIALPLRLDPDGAAIQVIPVLERHGDRLRSTGMTWGGFMPLHSGDGGWRPPPSTLSAHRSIAGNHEALISMSDAGLEQLASRAAREILAAALTDHTPPRRRGFTGMSSANPPFFLIYLMLRIPEARRVSITGHGRLGVGLVDRRSRSLAVVTLRSPWGCDSSNPRRRVQWRLQAYGGAAAADELEQLVSDWQQLRVKRQTQLEITANRVKDTLALAFAWANG